MNVIAGLRNSVALALAVLSLMAAPAGAQSLRFSNRRVVAVPDYATIRLEPLYSTLLLSQSIGPYYVRMRGRGVDFLFSNHRGEFKRDGFDFPVITTLAMRNYLIISRRMDLEANVSVQYRYYPMRTQENEWVIDFSDEGIFTDLSTEFMLLPTLRGRLYDTASYRTQYIDFRGEVDRYGGDRFERFENEVGLDLDWLISRYDNLALSLARQDLIPVGDTFTRKRTFGYRETLAYERQISPYLVGGARGEASQRFTSESSDPGNYAQSLVLFANARLTPNTTAGASAGYGLAVTRGGDPFVRESKAALTVAGHVRSRLGPRLSHQVNGSRQFENAFLSGIDIADRIAYQINWQTLVLPGSLSTAFSRFDPVESDRSGWSDWQTQFTVAQRLSRLVRAQFMTGYALRWNDETRLQVPVDADADYTTWVSRLSMSMPLTRRIDLTAFAEHAERRSAAEQLRYIRDMVAATASWSHRF